MQKPQRTIRTGILFFLVSCATTFSFPPLFPPETDRTDETQEIETHPGTQLSGHPVKKKCREITGEELWVSRTVR